MQSLSTLIRISKVQNIESQWLGKYYILGNNQAKQGVGIKVWFVPNTVG